MALITPFNTESRHKWFQICHRSSSAISGFLVISLRFSYPHDHKIVAMASLSHDNSNIGRKDELLPRFWSSPQTSWTISLVLSYMTTISPITGKRCLAPIIGSASGFDLEVGPISAELMAAYSLKSYFSKEVGRLALGQEISIFPTVVSIKNTWNKNTQRLCLLQESTFPGLQHGYIGLISPRLHWSPRGGSQGERIAHCLWGPISLLPWSSPSFPADTPLWIMYQVAMIPKHQCIKGVCSLVHHGMRKIRMLEWDSYKAKLIPLKGKLLLTFLLKLSDGFRRHLKTRLPPWLRSVLQAQLLSYLTRPGLPGSLIVSQIHQALCLFRASAFAICFPWKVLVLFIYKVGYFSLKPQLICHLLGERADELLQSHDHFHSHDHLRLRVTTTSHCAVCLPSEPSQYLTLCFCWLASEISCLFCLKVKSARAEASLDWRSLLFACPPTSCLSPTAHYSHLHSERDPAGFKSDHVSPLPRTLHGS